MSQIVLHSSKALSDSNRAMTATRRARAGLMATTALALGLAIVAPQMLAAQTWDGDTNTDWSTANNWDTNSVPNNGATVTIDTAAGNQPNVLANETVQQTDVSAGTLTVTATLTSDVSASGTGVVNILAGGEINGNIDTSDTGLVSNAGTVTGNVTVAGGTFNNALTVTGSTTISGGELNLNTGSALADDEDLVVNGGTVNVNASDTVGELSGTGGTIDIDTGRTLTSTNTGAATFAGAINGAGTFTKLGGGTLTLSGTNQQTGSLRVEAGVVALTGTTASPNIFLATGASLTAGGARLSATNGFTGDGTLIANGNETVGNLAGFTGDIQVNNTSTLTLAGSGTYAITGAISGNGGITVNGALVQYSTANTYSGATVVTSGGLAVNAALSSTTVTVNGGGLSSSNGSLAAGTNLTLAGGTGMSLTGDDTIASLTHSAGTLTGAGTLTVNGAYALSGTGATGGTITVVANSFTMSGTASIASGTTVTSAGTKVLSGGTVAGTLDGAGATTIQSGSVTVSGLIDGNVTVAAGGTLRIANSNAISGSITTTGSVISYADTVVEASAVILNSNSTQLEVLTGESATQQGVISDFDATDRPIEKIGGGTLILSGANTYDGATTVTAGTLSITGSIESAVVTVNGSSTLRVDGAALLDTAAVTLNGTSTFDLTGSETIGSLTGASGTFVTLGGNTLTTGDGTSTTFAGIISGMGGALVKQGNGTFTLSGANIYTGSTTVNAGILDVTGVISSAVVTVNNAATLRVDGGALGALSGVTLNNTATLDLTGSETIGSLTGASGTFVTLAGNTLTTGDATNTTFAGVMSGTGGALIKQGSGTFTLSGANTYTGSTTVNTGILDVTGSITSAVVTVNNAATLRVDGASLLDTAAVTLNNTATLNLTGSETIGSLTGASGSFVTLGGNTLTTGDGNSTTFAGVMSGTGGALIKQGAGTFTLSGANSYTGSTTVNAGILDITGSIASAVVTANGSSTLRVDGSSLLDTAAVTLNGTSTFDLTGNERIGSLSGASGSFVTLNANTLTTGDATSTTFAGVISGSGGLIKEGSGTFTLTGSNSYSGVTNINAGVVNVQNNDALGTNAGGTVVASGAALQLQGGINMGGELLTLNGSGIANDGALRNISGNNGFTGTITLASGARINSDSGTLTTGLINNGGFTLTMGGSGNIDVNGTMSGLGGLIKDGSGQLFFATNNTYQGDTTINAGTVQIGGSIASAVVTVNNAALLMVNGTSLANTAAVTLNNTASMSLSGSETIGSLAGASGATVVLNANTLTTGDATSTTFAGVMSGTGGALIKQGSGTFTLSGANTYTGSTTVNAGVLDVTGSIASAVVTVNNAATLRVDGASLANTAAVTLNNTATLDLTGSETIGSLAGASGTFVTLGGNTLTTGDATNTSFAGIMSGTGGSLVKQGSGSFTLTGANSYTGGTTVNAGTLILNAAGVLADSGDVTVAGGTLTANFAETIDALSQTGGTINGTATITANGGFTQSGGTTGGTVTINTTTFGQSGGATIASGTAVSASGAQTLAGGTISGNLTGAGAVTVQTGTTTLTGTITAATTVASGILNVTGGTITGAAENDGGTVNVVSGTFTGGLTNTDGTLNLAGTINGNIINADDAFATANTLFSAGNTYGNSGTTQLAGFSFSGLTSFTNQSGGILSIGPGGSLSAVTVSNLLGGQAFLDGATIAGAFTNGGVLGVNGAGIITGSMVNTGTVTLLDGNTDDTLTVSGPISGGGIYALDINLDTGATDLITATGNDATGLIQLAFDPGTTGDSALLSDIVVFDGVGPGATITQSGLPTGGAILYNVAIDGANNIVVNSTINPAVSGVAAGAAVTQSLIGTVVNRPTSPFVTGLALEESCSSGGYLRASTGQASITGEFTNNNISKTSNVDARFSGVQGGFDVGCYDGRFFNGWDAAIGVMLGYNQGSTLQGVFSDAIDDSILTGTSGSDFTQTYAGLYVAGSKDRISGDVQLRFDRTEFDLSETTFAPYLPIGLDGLSYGTDSTTFGTRLNYRFDVNEDKGINFVPTIGFNYTSTSGALLTLNGGNGTLEITPFNTVVGFIGGTLTKTKIGEDGQSATTTFVSGNYYKDFGGDRLAIFESTSLPATPISMGSLGGFAEASVGVNYVKVLEKGPAGAKQLNANLRADARFGQNVSDSYSLTAQVRLSF